MTSIFWNKYFSVFMMARKQGGLYRSALSWSRENAKGNALTDAVTWEASSTKIAPKAEIAVM